MRVTVTVGGARSPVTHEGLTPAEYAKAICARPKAQVSLEVQWDDEAETSALQAVGEAARRAKGAIAADMRFSTGSEPGDAAVYNGEGDFMGMLSDLRDAAREEQEGGAGG